MKATNVCFVFIECLQCLVLRYTQSMQVLLLKNGLRMHMFGCVCVCVCVRGHAREKALNTVKNLDFFSICIF